MESTEINQSFASVYKPFVPHFLKGQVSAFDDLFIKCKDKAGPIYAGTKSTELGFKIRPIARHKLPNLLVQLFAAEIETTLPLPRKLLLVDDLRFKSCMISPWQKEGSLPLHSIIANGNILQCKGKCTA